MKKSESLRQLALGNRKLSWLGSFADEMQRLEEENERLKRDVEKFNHKDVGTLATASEGREGPLPQASGGKAGCLHSMNAEGGHANPGVGRMYESEITRLENAIARQAEQLRDALARAGIPDVKRECDTDETEIR